MAIDLLRLSNNRYIARSVHDQNFTRMMATVVQVTEPTWLHFTELHNIEDRRQLADDLQLKIGARHMPLFHSLTYFKCVPIHGTDHGGSWSTCDVLMH